MCSLTVESESLADVAWDFRAKVPYLSIHVVVILERACRWHWREYSVKRPCVFFFRNFPVSTRSFTREERQAAVLESR